MINNVYIERKLRFWRLRISARQSGILQAKVEFSEIPIQVKNVIFVNLHKNIEIFTLRSNQLRQNYSGGVQNLKNWFPWFFTVYGGFSRFFEVFDPKPTSKKFQKIQNFCFPKIASKHVLMVNMIVKHVQDIRRTHFMPYNMILNNLKQFLKNRFFTKNAIFCNFWDFLIFD